MPYLLRVILLSYLSIFLANSLHASSDVTSKSEYILSVKDLIEINVFKQKSFEGITQRIDGNGNIQVYLIGKVKVAGLTVREAETKLKVEFIRKEIFRNPQVSIFIKEYYEKEASVLGQVNKPGQITFPIETNALDIVEAISKAGGFSNIAKKSAVVITRTLPNNQKRKFEVNVDTLIENQGSTTQGFMILPDDVIFVPKRVF